MIRSASASKNKTIRDERNLKSHHSYRKLEQKEKKLRRQRSNSLPTIRTNKLRSPNNSSIVSPKLQPSLDKKSLLEELTTTGKSNYLR